MLIQQNFQLLWYARSDSIVPEYSTCLYMHSPYCAWQLASELEHNVWILCTFSLYFSNFFTLSADCCWFCMHASLCATLNMANSLSLFSFSARPTVTMCSQHSTNPCSYLRVREREIERDMHHQNYGSHTLTVIHYNYIPSSNLLSCGC